jgi:hypothetical protein
MNEEKMAFGGLEAGALFYPRTTRWFRFLNLKSLFFHNFKPILTYFLELNNVSNPSSKIHSKTETRIKNESKFASEKLAQKNRRKFYFLKH